MYETEVIELGSFRFLLCYTADEADAQSAVNGKEVTGEFPVTFRADRRGAPCVL